MSSNLMLLCKFGLETFVVNVNCEMLFSDFALKVCENWSSLNVKNVSFSYSIHEHPSCFLRNDVDFKNMIMLARMVGLCYVSIDVVHGSMETVPVQNSTGTVSNNSTGTVFNNSTGTVSNIVPVGTVSNTGVDSYDDTLDVDLYRGSSSSCKDKPLLCSNWSSLILRVGQEFVGGADEFRDAICRYATEVGFEFMYERNNKNRIEVVCAKKFAEGCPWSIVASLSKVDGNVYIKKFNNVHKCGLTIIRDRSKRMSRKILGKLIVDQVASKPSMSPIDVIIFFKDNYGMEISYDKAWSAVEKAKAMIYGEYDESFNKLRLYVKAAMDLNPGSHIVLDVDEGTSRFRRLFVSFGASIRGFKYCRPIIFIDGTFLKSRFRGVLMAATGKDANNGLFPLAFAVVDSENFDNWSWFLGHLREILDTSEDFTFISDRNPGLMESLPIKFPTSHHFFCLQHLKNNLRDKFSRGNASNRSREYIVNLFCQCAYAPTVAAFREKLDVLKREGGAIVDNFLSGLPVQNWTNAYACSRRYGEMSSNAVESFNAWILDARNMPVSHLVDKIRVKLMEWFAIRKRDAAKWNGLLCPRMEGKFSSLVDAGRTWSVKMCSDTVYEVFSSPTTTVDLVNRTCSCYDWQISGFPCSHAFAVIGRISRPLSEFVDEYFHVDKYRLAYEGVIVPIPTATTQEFSDCNSSSILPPVTRRPAGRPKKRRIRSTGELVRRIRCGRCGRMGSHNKKTCKEPLS